MAACPAGHASHRSRSQTGADPPGGHSRPPTGGRDPDPANLTSPGDQETRPLRPLQPERQAEIPVGVLGQPLARVRSGRPIAELGCQHLGGDELTVLGQRRR